MDVCTDQQVISQDYQTEMVLINQQEIPEEWPTEESFIRKEILKWTNILNTEKVNMGFQLF